MFRSDSERGMGGMAHSTQVDIIISLLDWNNGLKFICHQDFYSKHNLLLFARTSNLTAQPCGVVDLGSK